MLEMNGEHGLGSGHKPPLRECDVSRFERRSPFTEAKGCRSFSRQCAPARSGPGVIANELRSTLPNLRFRPLRSVSNCNYCDT
jgi:hypothetical protein